MTNINIPNTPPPRVRPLYRNSIVGIVANGDIRKENYLGGINALTTLDLLVIPTNSQQPVSISLSGTRFFGPTPKKGDIVELNLAHSAHRRGERFYQTKTLYNHTAGVQLRTETSASGLAGTARRATVILTTAVVIFVITIFATVAIVGIRAVSTARSTAQSRTLTLTIPQLTGMNMTEASATLAKSGFQLGEYTFVHKQSGEAFGTVINSNPPAGTKVAVVRAAFTRPTSAISINISTGGP